MSVSSTKNPLTLGIQLQTSLKSNGSLVNGTALRVARHVLEKSVISYKTSVNTAGRKIVVPRWLARIERYGSLSADCEKLALLESSFWHVSVYSEKQQSLETRKSTRIINMHITKKNKEYRHLDPLLIPNLDVVFFPIVSTLIGTGTSTASN